MFKSNQVLTPSLTLQMAQARAGTLKTGVQNIINESSSGNIAAYKILELTDWLLEQKSQFQSYTSVPGIGQYIKDQFNDQAYDIVTEFNALLTEIDNTVTWITTNFPNSNGNLHVYQFAPDGKKQDVLFTPAQSSGLRTILTNIVNAIE